MSQPNQMQLIFMLPDHTKETEPPLDRHSNSKRIITQPSNKTTNSSVPSATKNTSKSSFCDVQAITLQANSESRVARWGRRGRVEGCQWSPEEERKLLEMHNSLGNRWSRISKSFAGRTDNSIKNHFFARLRMSLRYLYQQLGSRIALTKTIQVQSLYKIISVYDQKFKESPGADPELILRAENLKNRIFNYFYSEQTEDHVALQLARDIYHFSTHFHKRKRNTTHSPLPSNADQYVESQPSEFEDETIEKDESCPRDPKRSSGVEQMDNAALAVGEIARDKQPQSHVSEVNEINLEGIMGVELQVQKSAFIAGLNPFLSFNQLLSPEESFPVAREQDSEHFYPDHYSPFLLFDSPSEQFGRD